MSTPPTPALTAVLDELDELRAKATPGPWEVRWQCPEESHHHDWDEGWIADPEGATVAVVQERYTSAPADAALIVGAVNRLPQLTAALRAVLAVHLPSHSYCVVCDVERDVEAVGNNPTCEHRTSFCRACEIAWPCPTVAAITTALEAS